MADTIKIRCAKCGSYDFKYEGGVQDNLKLNDIVTCAGCGASGEYGPLIKDAKKQAADEITTKFRKLFK